jgi:hypothetical protein
MSETEHPSKSKGTVRNIVYSFLVFYVSFAVLIVILDYSALDHASIHQKLNAKDFLAFGLSIAAAIVFYKWLRKRNNRERSIK